MTAAPDPSKPTYILDTGPLSVLCGFPIRGTPFVHTIVSVAEVRVPDTVITEIGNVGRMAQILTPLLKSGALLPLQTPVAPLILDTAYSRDLGAGERSVIKCGLAFGSQVVLDDQDAFIVACRFGLRPIGFQDMMVQLVAVGALSKDMAIEIVRTTARQFKAAYLTHTLDMLYQEKM